MSASSSKTTNSSVFPIRWPKNQYVILRHTQPSVSKQPSQTYILITKSGRGVTAQISDWNMMSVTTARDSIVLYRPLNPAPFGLWNAAIPSSKGGLVIGKEGKTLRSLEERFGLKIDVVARGEVCEIRPKEAKSRDAVLDMYSDVYSRIAHSQDYREILSSEHSKVVRGWLKAVRLLFIAANNVYLDVTEVLSVTVLRAWSADSLKMAKDKIEQEYSNSKKPFTKQEKKPQAVKSATNMKPAAVPVRVGPIKDSMYSVLKSLDNLRFRKPSDEEINILLLGESGIGKSTFINGFYNHLKYMSFEEARRKGIVVCIRASFSYLDQSGASHIVTVESSGDPVEKANEILESGKSATRDPRSYVFEVKRDGFVKVIRLIDSPGVLDTSGMEQDLLNMKKTFGYVSNFKNLNAICILMRADEFRLNHYVRYCISELLTRLHCDAARNLLFCFTRSSGTDFRPAGTLDLLRRLAEEMKRDSSVKVKLNSDTLFCFDNLPFRLLCAAKKVHRLSAEELKSAKESWEQSHAQMKRMLECVEKIPPHDVQKTLIVNEARTTVLSLARPLADLTKNQIVNQESIKEKMTELDQHLAARRILKEQLVCEQQTIRAVALKNPQLVCADPICVDYKTIGGRTELHYKVVCHDNCVTDTKVNGDQQVQKCSVFSNGVDKCAKCGHSWQTHTHIRYKLEISAKTIDVSALKSKIERNTDLVNLTQEFIGKLKKKHVTLNVDLNLMASACAKFASFVDANSIMSYNDTYKQCIETAITEETYKLSYDLGSVVLLDRLKEFKTNYELEIKSMKGVGEAVGKAPSVEEVAKLIKDLKSRNLGGHEPSAHGWQRSRSERTPLHSWTGEGGLRSQPGPQDRGCQRFSEGGQRNEGELWADVKTGDSSVISE